MTCEQAVIVLAYLIRSLGINVQDQFYFVVREKPNHPIITAAFSPF